MPRCDLKVHDIIGPSRRPKIFSDTFMGNYYVLSDCCDTYIPFYNDYYYYKSNENKYYCKDGVGCKWHRGSTLTLAISFDLTKKDENNS